MFTHEADIKVVEIEDCHPNAIKIMLEFMYGSKNIDQQSFEKYACQIIYVADKYNVIGLKEKCEDVLGKALNVNVKKFGSTKFLKKS